MSMFTGLVEECGKLVRSEIVGSSGRMTVQCELVNLGSKMGDSIAVNGCCLTVVQMRDNELTFDAVPETLARTNLGALKAGDPVNLERPLAVGDRLGGHFVQGHIDGVGKIVSSTENENAVVLEIYVPEPLRRYLVEKGSVTVDGVSLTVAEVREQTFTVWTIPHTRAVTNLGNRKPGDIVNLECDLLGKYIERLLETRMPTPSPPNPLSQKQERG